MLEKIKNKRDDLVKESNDILNELNNVLRGFETLLDDETSLQAVDEKFKTLLKKGKELKNRYDQLEQTTMNFMKDNEFGDKVGFILGLSCMTTIKKLNSVFDLVDFDHIEEKYREE
jgi:predicted nuclease with TOPRIM domain